MTPERLREIARDCEDASVVYSESNANELRRLADHLDTCFQHSWWVWNRRNEELLERANSTWRNQQMSTNAVANKLMDLIVEHCGTAKEHATKPNTTPEAT